MAKVLLHDLVVLKAPATGRTDRDVDLDCVYSHVGASLSALYLLIIFFAIIKPLAVFDDEKCS